MTKPYVNAYISNLQRQITDAAAKVRRSRIKDFPTAETQDSFPREYVWSKVDVQSYNLLDSNVHYLLTATDVPATTEYAADLYQSTADSIRKPTVVEGFVFKNNREFDFKV